MVHFPKLNGFYSTSSSIRLRRAGYILTRQRSESDARVCTTQRAYFGFTFRIGNSRRSEERRRSQQIAAEGLYATTICCCDVLLCILDSQLILLKPGPIAVKILSTRSKAAPFQRLEVSVVVTCTFRASLDAHQVISLLYLIV